LLEPMEKSAAAGPLLADAAKGRPGRSSGDRTWAALVVALGGTLLVAAGLILLVLFRLAQPLGKVISPLAFLVGQEWDVTSNEFGALPFIYGTVVTSVLAMLLAVPASVGMAVFLVEMAPAWARPVVSFLIETLAAIPSVVYGLWGLFILVPWLRGSVEPLLARALGFLPLFQGPPIGLGYLAAGVVLAVMILPTISSVSIEVLKTVPAPLREGAYGLGATRWEAIRMAVLPYARSGIMGGALLGLGRALGETMAVTMVIGNSPSIHASLFAPGYTLPAVIANEFAEATGAIQVGALAALGLVLFGLSLVLNAVARLLVHGVARGPRRRRA
jgi:phosphate transport system permease protein